MKNNTKIKCIINSNKKKIGTITPQFCRWWDSDDSISGSTVWPDIETKFPNISIFWSQILDPTSGHTLYRDIPDHDPIMMIPDSDNTSSWPGSVQVLVELELYSGQLGIYRYEAPWLAGVSDSRCDFKLAKLEER